MKRKCSGCRAQGLLWGGPDCHLGYKTEPYSKGGRSGLRRPLEDCPKPITWGQLRKLMPVCDNAHLRMMMKAYG